MTPCDLETVDLGLLYPAILAIAPGTSIPYMNFYLGHAVADMALRTKAITTTFTQDAQRGVTTYPIDVPEGYTVAYIESVCVLGTAHDSTAASCPPTGPGAQPCTIPFPDRCPTHEVSSPTFSVSECGKYVTVSPAPTADTEDGVVVRMSLLPSRTACSMPKEMYDRYSSEIVDAVLSRILLNPTYKTPPNTLALINSRLERGVRRARQDAAAGQGEGGYRPIKAPLEGWML